MRKKILIMCGTMDQGGAETFLMKLLRVFDFSKFDVDFYLFSKHISYYENELKELHCNIYKGESKTSNFSKYRTNIVTFFKENYYDFVLRISQDSISALDLYYAKKNGNKKVTIFRSSNTKGNGKLFFSFFHYFFRPIANCFSDIKIGPSTEANIFMFGKKNVKRGNAKILHNGLNIENFRFNSSIRDFKRNELGISPTTITLLHVGRFEKQKNHHFLLNIFSIFSSKHPNTKLILVGDGSYKNQILAEIKDKNLEKNVILLSKVENMSDIYMASDLLLLPSLYEGMPNVAIEAQASGLFCILSEKITKEASITPNILYLPIFNPNVWAEEIMRISRNQYLNLRSNVTIPAYYDIKEVSKLFVSTLEQFKEKQ